MRIDAAANGMAAWRRVAQLGFESTDQRVAERSFRLTVVRRGRPGAGRDLFELHWSGYRLPLAHSAVRLRDDRRRDISSRRRVHDGPTC